MFAQQVLVKGQPMGQQSEGEKVVLIRLQAAAISMVQAEVILNVVKVTAPPAELEHLLRHARLQVIQ